MIDHYYRNVKGWAAFAPLYFEIMKTANDGDNFVEVGSWLGKSAALLGVEIANSKKDIKLFCVDPWIDGGPDLRDTEHFKNVAHTPLIDQFKANIEPVKQHIIPMQMMSVEAASKFEDKSVDFIMLDGDHSYEAVRDDIAAWLPKMKPGSIMSGDDYGWPGVTKAVNEVFGRRAGVTWVRHHHNYLLSASYWQVKL